MNIYHMWVSRMSLFSKPFHRKTAILRYMFLGKEAHHILFVESILYFFRLQILPSLQKRSNIGKISIEFGAYWTLTLDECVLSMLRNLPANSLMDFDIDRYPLQLCVCKWRCRSYLMNDTYINQVWHSRSFLCRH